MYSVQKIDKELADRVSESLNVPDEALENIIELSGEDFRRGVQLEIESLNRRIQEYVNMYNQSQDLTSDHIVRYFRISGGMFGFVEFGKKLYGFNIPEYE